MRAVPATALVDGENVRRSGWPNVGQRELVVRCRAWAEREGVTLLVVFDGDAPCDAPDVAGTGRASADDRIVEIAGEAVGPLWLVTSDRELRNRVGGRAEPVIGGGTFLRELLRD